MVLQYIVLFSSFQTFDLFMEVLNLFMEVFDLFMEVLTCSWRCSPASKWEIATLFFSVPPIRCPAQVAAATSLIG